MRRSFCCSSLTEVVAPLAVPGITGQCGVNNMGLLVRCWGVVTYVDPSSRFFYVDDGMNLNDGSGLTGATGVRVLLTGIVAAKAVVPPPVGHRVVVTGISAPFKIGVRVVRGLRVRSQEDIAPAL